MASFASPQAAAAPFKFDEREVKLQEVFLLHRGHAQSCAKATLVGLPDNPYRLTQLWTLLLVAISGGKTAGAAALEVLETFDSFGIVDRGACV